MSMKDSSKSLGWKQKRECLRCQKEFNSEGKWNRICPECGVLNMQEEVHEYKVHTEEINTLWKPDWYDDD